MSSVSSASAPDKISPSSSLPSPMGTGGKLYTCFLGAIILFFGMFFVVGGLELIWYGGSWYYLICGLLLLVSGVYLLAGRALGAWLYLLAWGGTFLWTLYEVGFNFWDWIPRLFGPTLIAFGVLLALPLLSRRKN